MESLLGIAWGCTSWRCQTRSTMILDIRRRAASMRTLQCVLPLLGRVFSVVSRMRCSNSASTLWASAYAGECRSPPSNPHWQMRRVKSARSDVRPSGDRQSPSWWLPDSQAIESCSEGLLSEGNCHFAATSFNVLFDDEWFDPLEDLFFR